MNNLKHRSSFLISSRSNPMGVYGVLLYDLLFYVNFFFSLDTWLSYVHSLTSRVLLRIKQLSTWVLCNHLKSLILYMFWHWHWGYPSYDEQSGCICLILAAKVSSSPVTTPHSLSQTLVRSLYHLVLAMFFISIMLCWFQNSLKTFYRLDNFVMIAKAMPSWLRLPLCCQGSTHA